MTPEEEKRYLIEIATIQFEAEAKSPFKLFQMVSACQSSSISLNDGTSEHDHVDPDQHFLTRVVGWDSYGRVQVATKIYSNPHCSEWCWTDSSLTPFTGKDWYSARDPSHEWHDDRLWWNVGTENHFMWELPDFGTTLGLVVPCVIRAPHINYGDWIVLYEVPENKETYQNKRWITRVVNENQFIDRKPPKLVD